MFDAARDSMINQNAVHWAGFILLVIVMLALDLGVLQRGKQAMSTTESLFWCGIWTGLAMIFNVWLFFFYPRGTEAGWIRVPFGSLRTLKRPSSLRSSPTEL